MMKFDMKTTTIYMPPQYRSSFDELKERLEARYYPYKCIAENRGMIIGLRHRRKLIIAVFVTFPINANNIMKYLKEWVDREDEIDEEVQK